MALFLHRYVEHLIFGEYIYSAKGRVTLQK